MKEVGPDGKRKIEDFQLLNFYSTSFPKMDPQQRAETGSGNCKVPEHDRLGFLNRAVAFVAICKCFGF